MLFLSGFINIFMITPIVYFLLREALTSTLYSIFQLQLSLDSFSIKVIAFIISITIVLYLYCASKKPNKWIKKAISQYKCRDPNIKESKILLFIKEQLTLRYNQIDWNKIVFLVTDNNIVNGLAIGDKIIILPAGCFIDLVTQEEISALIAHELGHIYDKSNLDRTSYVYMDRVLFPFAINSFESNNKQNDINKINNYILLVHVIASTLFYGCKITLFVFVIFLIILSLRAKQFRDSEFTADAFTKKFNLQEHLYKFLNRYTEEKVKVSFKNLFKTHPSSSKRMQRLLQN